MAGAGSQQRYRWRESEGRTVVTRGRPSPLRQLKEISNTLTEALPDFWVVGPRELQA